MITIRNLCLFFAFLLFSASFISAISTDMSKEYSGGETVVVKLSGNILEPIDPSQVEFKKENVRVPFSYDLKKLGDGKYYLWFVTPSNAVIQNYTLLIKGISTTVDGVVEKIDFMQNFTVLQTANEYYIEPGFIFTKEDFQISATLNRDEDTNIEIDFPNQHTITLMSGKNNLDFSIRDFVSTAFLLIRVGKYTVPAYIVKNQSNIAVNKYIDILPYRIYSIREIDSANINYQFNLKNIWQSNIEDLYLQYNNSIFSITPDDKTTLEINDIALYNIQLKNKDNRDISEIIYIKSDINNVSYALPIEIFFVENISALNYSNINNTNFDGLYTCRELLGTTCKALEECNGDTQVSKDGICCVGRCAALNKSSSKAWIGYLIAGLVLIGLVFIYLKYKSVRNDKNPIKMAADNDKKKRIP